MKRRQVRRKLARLLVGLIGITWSVSALAMPPVAAIVAAWTWIQWAYVAFVVASTIYSSSAARRKARKAQDKAINEYNANLQDRSITALRALPPWRVCYGRCITGGDIRAIFTSDKSFYKSNGASDVKADSYKHLVITIADHEVAGLNEVYVEGVPIGLASVDVNGWVTTGDLFQTGTRMHGFTLAPGGVLVLPASMAVLTATYPDGVGADEIQVAGSYSLSASDTTITNTTPGKTLSVTVQLPNNQSRLRVSFHNGTDTQTVDTYLNGIKPTEWTTDHRLRGKAYVVLTLDLEHIQFQSLVNFTFDVSGKLCYDPRTATTVYTENPAICIRDFLLGEYGFDCDTVDVQDTYIIDSANVCDTVINFEKYNALGVIDVIPGPRFNCNGCFTTDDSKEAVFQDLLGTMCGTANYGAAWRVFAGSWTAPVMALTDDDLMGQITVPQADEGLDDLFNGIRGTHIPFGTATPVDFDEYQNATFVINDGAELWDSITLPYTDFSPRARNIARIRTEQNRSGFTINYPGKLHLWPLQIGDRVTVTSAEYGFSAKTFRVTDWQFDSSSAVALTLREDDATIYDEADAASADPTPNTGLPSPWVVPTPTFSSTTIDNLYNSDGSVVYRVKVGWPAPTNPFMVNGLYRLDWFRSGDDPLISQSATAPAAQEFVHMTGIQPNTYYTIKLVAINDMGAVSSPVFGTVFVPNASYPVNENTFVYSSNMILLGNAVKKVGPTHGAWDAHVYSKDGFKGGAFASFRVFGAQLPVMGGLNSDPATDASYISLDYAWYSVADGTCQVWAAGAPLATGFAQVVGDVFAVVYDGYNVRWMQNGVVKWEVVAPANQTLHFDSSLNWQSDTAGMGAIRFGPLSMIAELDTGQIVVGAATDVYSTTVASASVTANSHVPDGISFRTPIATLTFVPSIGDSANVDVLVTAISLATVTAGAFAAYSWYSLQNAAAFDAFNDDNTLASPANVPAGTTQYSTNTKTLRLSVPGNVSLTVGLYGKRLDGFTTFTVSGIELRAEVIKR